MFKRVHTQQPRLPSRKHSFGRRRRISGWRSLVGQTNNIRTKHRQQTNKKRSKSSWQNQPLSQAHELRTDTLYTHAHSLKTSLNHQHACVCLCLRSAWRPAMPEFKIYVYMICMVHVVRTGDKTADSLECHHHSQRATDSGGNVVLVCVCVHTV